MSGEKEQTRTDPADPECGRSGGGGEREETSSGTWVLPLFKPLFGVGKEKEKRNWVFENGGFAISFGKGGGSKGWYTGGRE